MKGELPEKEKKKAEDSDSDADEDKYADEMDMPGTKVWSWKSSPWWLTMAPI